MPAQSRLGRPLTGLFLDFGFGLISTVDDLRWLRLFAVTCLGGLGITVYMFLRASGHSAAFAVVGATGLAMLTPFQAFVSWAVCFPYILGAWVAFVGGWHVTRHVNREVQEGHLLPRWSSIFVSAGLVAAASMIYQPIALLFWVSSTWLLVHCHCELKVFVARVGAVFVAGVGGIAVGFLAFRVGVTMHGEHDSGRSGFTDDIFGKLGWFFSEALPQVTQLQWAGFKLPMGLALTIIAYSVVGSFLGKEFSVRKAIPRVLFAFVAFFLCYLTSLIAMESWAASRTLVAVFALFWLFFLNTHWRLVVGVFAKGRTSILSGGRLHLRDRVVVPFQTGCAFAAALTLSLMGQFGAVQGFLIPQSYEWARVHQSVAEFARDSDRSSQHIVVRQSSWHVSSRTPLYDEHWLQSGSHGWAAVAMTRLALNAIGEDSRNWSVEVVSYDQDHREVDVDMAKFAF